MKNEGHPNWFDAEVECVGCGNKWVVGSTLKAIRVNICSACHPFYTGKQKFVDSEGRVDKFNKKYAKFQSAKQGANS